MKLLLFPFIAAFVLFTMSCQEKIAGPLTKSEKKPDKVTNVTVENLPGGAKVSFSLPDDKDILYVLAEFSSKEGEVRQVKSSVYKNYIILDGFITTEEQDIRLYAVSRSEKLSDPVNTVIVPLQAPIYKVYESFNVRSDFGGVSTHFINEDLGEYVLHTLMKDSSNNWTTYDRLYTSSKERNYAIRGLPSEPLEFGFFFTDKWQNRSDTLLKTITPLFEEEIDKSKFKHLPLDNDSYESLYPQSHRQITALWDGTPDRQHFFVSPTIPGLALPNWLTIDLGQTVSFSRIKVNQYYTGSNNGWLYAKCSPRKFQLWGSNDPESDGSWRNWTLLGNFESQKPSGLPAGSPLTNEDIAAAKEGEDFSIEFTGQSYRYVRFVTVNTWDSQLAPCFGELTFFGQTVD